MSIAKEILIQAKQVIVDNGWCQGKVMNAAGQCCMAGALNLATAGDVNRYYGTGREEARRFLGKFVPYGGVVEFNDADGRTKEEVLAIFDKAIEAAS